MISETKIAANKKANFAGCLHAEQQSYQSISPGILLASMLHNANMDVSKKSAVELIEGGIPAFSTGAEVPSGELESFIVAFEVLMRER